jgi:ribosomal protein S10
VKKSPHVFGRSKERFTFSVHNKTAKLAIRRGKDLNQFLNFIRNNRYAGLGIQVVYSSIRKI